MRKLALTNRALMSIQLRVACAVVHATQQQRGNSQGSKLRKRRKERTNEM
jgi:hypothetical protein